MSTSVENRGECSRKVIIGFPVPLRPTQRRGGGGGGGGGALFANRNTQACARKEEGGRALACGRRVCVGGVHTTAIQKDDLSVFPCPSATEDFFRALYLHEEPHHNILLKRAREGPSH